MIALDLELQLLDLAQEVLLLFFLELRLLVLRVEQAIDGVDLALNDADAFDRVLHLLDQPPLHRLGEFDLADVLRHLDQRPHRLDLALAVLAAFAVVLALRGLLQLLVELLVGRARLADGVDLLLHLLAALDDALVGDLFVVEDDQLADGAVAGVQLIAEVDDLLGDQRRARNRLDDRELAALDAPRDLDLALAGEQRDGAHLAQIHADRVVGLVERAGREIELELLGALRRPIDRLDVVAQIFLVGIDDFDAGAAEDAEELVEFVRRRDVGRQRLVDLVVEEVALLFALIDELTDLVIPLFDGEMRLVDDVGALGGGRNFLIRCHS